MPRFPGTILSRSPTPRSFGKKKAATIHRVLRSARVPVITGIGVVSPIGTGTGKFWENLNKSVSGIGRISLFDPSHFPSQIAAEVKDFDPAEHLTKTQRKNFSRATAFAVAAAQMSMLDAGAPTIDPYRTDVLIGSAVSGYDRVQEDLIAKSLARGETELYQPGAIDPLAMLKSFIHAPASAVALRYSVKGYVSTISTACSSGLNAIGQAAERIRSGLCDSALAGGVDTPITRFFLAGYCAANFLTTENQAGTEALCPFDRRRTGAALGEGSAVFLIEEKRQALARGARIYCEVAAFQQENENVNEVYLSDRSGNAWAQMLRNLLDKLGSRQIDHINAHGPSDIWIDKLEARALHKAFPTEAAEIPTTSIKGQVGSGMASAGVFQVAAGALTLLHGVIPPVFNYREPDPECDLNLKRTPKHRPLRQVLINGHAVGGINAALVLRKHNV